MSTEDVRRFYDREDNEERNGKKGGRIVAYAAAILLLLLLITWLIYHFVFVIQETTAVASAHYSAEEILEAAGIRAGTRLFSFSSLDVSERIRRECPYICDVEVTRKIPSAVSIAVKEETAVFWSEIYGETWLLSSGLRLLEISSETEGKIHLKLPAVAAAMAGKEIVFVQDATMGPYAREVAGTVLVSGLAERMDWIDLRNRTDLRMVCDGLYLLEMGTFENLEVKLHVARTILQDEMFSAGSRAKLDLTRTTDSDRETSVIIDNELSLD